MWLLAAMLDYQGLEQWFLKCGAQASSNCITWELLEMHPIEVEILRWNLAVCVLTYPSGYADVCKRLRTSVAEEVYDSIVIILKPGNHLNVHL